MTWESSEEKGERETWWREALENRGFKSRFDQMHQAVVAGDITLAQVGGFTPSEMNSAYGGAWKLLNTGKVDEALQIAGYLILLDPWQGRHYYLAGACFHYGAKYDIAAQYYDVALGFREDASILMAQGEVLLMLKRRDDALSMLKRGVELAPNDNPNLVPHVERARQLLRRYLGDP